jgi:putative ABC transport system permease protein
MTLLQGRGFTAADRDDSEPVLLIGKSTAHKFWPGASALGRRLRPVWETRWRTVIGVVDDVKTFSMTGPPAWVDGELYVPLAQATAPPQNLALVARLGNDPAGFEQALPSIVHSACPTCAVSKIASMDAVVSDATAAPRSLAWLAGAFAALAVMLAAAGIYGVVSHAVVRRTREIGIRLALGSSPLRAAWLVMASSLRQVALGTAAGLALAWVFARWMQSLLYAVPTHDAISFAAPPVVLAAAALLASLSPLFRAARIDPARSLREG